MFVKSSKEELKTALILEPEWQEDYPCIPTGKLEGKSILRGK